MSALRPTRLAVELLAGLAAAAIIVGVVIAVGRSRPTAAPAAPAAQTSKRSPSPTAPPLPAPANYIPWAPLADAPVTSPRPAPTEDTHPSPPVPIPPGTPSCRASQLEGAGYDGGGIGGERSLQIVLLRNQSTAACVIGGFPDVSILDSAGRVLAAVTGSEARTFVPQPPAINFLLQPHTAALSPPGGFTAWHDVPGRAYMEVEWGDCARPTAARMWVTLPQGGGRLTLPFPLAASGSAACPTSSGVGRGPLAPTEAHWPPPRQYVNMSVTYDVPATARRGSALVYYVTLTNTSPLDYAPSPCPNYNEFIGPKDVVASFQLNCSPMGHLAPGARVTYQMLQIPATAPLGPTKLTWALSDTMVSIPSDLYIAPQTVTVTG